MRTRNVCLNGVEIVRYTKCCCGSITLEFDNGADSSMYLETFEQLGLDLSEAEEGQETCACNHCANRWGIDLCECGSGERVGECDCGSSKAHDTLGVKFDSFAAVLNAFNMNVYG